MAFKEKFRIVHIFIFNIKDSSAFDFPSWIDHDVVNDWCQHQWNLRSCNTYALLKDGYEIHRGMHFYSQRQIIDHFIFPKVVFTCIPKNTQHNCIAFCSFMVINFYWNFSRLLTIQRTYQRLNSLGFCFIKHFFN